MPYMTSPQIRLAFRDLIALLCDDDVRSLWDLIEGWHGPDADPDARLITLQRVWEHIDSETRVRFLPTLLSPSEKTTLLALLGAEKERDDWRLDDL
jgi:hypothetical protein